MRSVFARDLYEEHIWDHDVIFEEENSDISMRSADL